MRFAEQPVGAFAWHGSDAMSDRCVSWLPWYHDMGLVGCFLSPVANQVSTDYMKTEDFARPSACMAGRHQRGRRYGYQLLADLRLRHLRAPHFEPEPCQRPLRSFEMAAGWQWRRHDPARRNAGFCRCVRRRRVQGIVFPAKLRACRNHAWRSRSCRRARASRSNWSRKPS